MDHELEKLVTFLSKLPGLGKRSARRMVLHMLKHRDVLMKPLGDSILKTADAIKTCSSCGNLDTVSPCHMCLDPKRSEEQLAIVEEVSDLWAMERGQVFRGRYHVLGGVLSAIDGVGPEELAMGSLLQRLKPGCTFKEVIIATNATVEGQTTAHYVQDRIHAIHPEIHISRLAYGMPMGGELDYLDEGTLQAALDARKVMSLS